MRLLVVESPAKAKTISQYLGKNYHVVATYGHIRKVAKKDGVDKSIFKIKWQNEARKFLKAIPKGIKYEKIVLATDLDREGEAIAWHVKEVLKKRFVNFKRITFNAVTKDEILNQIQNEKEINIPKVNAYLARVALDYLIGFNLSPILWRKVPGSKSAGRVQSVALKILAEREREICLFKPQNYWSIQANLNNDKSAALTHFKNKKIKDKMSLKEAKEICLNLRKEDFNSYKTYTSDKQDKSLPPFITSSLQKFSFQNFGFVPTKTMQIAQQLYEGIEIDGKSLGLITYMRTDSVNLSKSFSSSLNEFVKKFHSEDMQIKKYQDTKEAQAAHEAIRPTNIEFTPDRAKKYLQLGQHKIYSAIWNRIVSSQLKPPIWQNTKTEISTNEKDIVSFSMKTLKYPGYLKLEKRKQEKIPTAKVKIIAFSTKKHTSTAPSRYSESSLIDTLEKLKIGRPSTYARISKTLKERNYIKTENKRLFVNEKGLVVKTFLEKYFANYLNYDFTAKMEEKLDLIVQKKEDYTRFLQNFWQNLNEELQKDFSEARDILGQNLEYYIQKYLKKTCELCKEKVKINIGKYGLFWNCTTYPKCNYICGLGSKKTFLFTKNNTDFYFYSKKENFYLMKEKDKERKFFKVPQEFQNLTNQEYESLFSLPIKIQKNIELLLTSKGLALKKDKKLKIISLKEWQNSKIFNQIILGLQ